MPKPGNQRGKRLPAGLEFSPGQVNLTRVLKLAQQHAGSRERLVEAIRAEYFASAAQSRRDPQERLGQQATRAYNVIVGMASYGLFILDSNTLTPEGERLLKVGQVQGDTRLHEEFAKHILRTCHGEAVIQGLRNLRDRQETITKASLAAELTVVGFDLPRATTHHTTLKNWLALSGLIKGRYNVDEDRYRELTGVSSDDQAEIASLTRAQRAWLQTLRRLAEIHREQPVYAKVVTEQATEEHGAVFRSDQLSAQVVRPLAEAGWLVLQHRSTGRGGKSGLVQATPKLLAVPLERLTGLPAPGLPADLRSRLNTPLDQIKSDLLVGTSDTHRAGLALELLALRLAVDVGLLPRHFRLRGKTTGGAEVDLVAEAAHLHFSRWLFQCKNTKSSDVTDLAKEIGMATLLRAQVVVMVTTGKFTTQVRDHAAELAKHTHFQVVLLDGAVVRDYLSRGPGTLLTFLRTRAKETMRLKEEQLAAPED